MSSSLVAESYEVKMVEKQIEAIEDASSRVWAIARDGSGNKGNLVAAALDLAGAIAAAKTALTFLVKSVPDLARDDEREAVRRWQHEEISRDAAEFGLDADVDFEAMIDAEYDAWRDGQDEMADAIAMHAM